MRPYIVCHMVSSIDGRLLPSRWTPALDSTDANDILHQYDRAAEHLGGQGWIVGRKTMEDMVPISRPNVLMDAPLDRPHHHGKRHGRNVAIAIDPTGKLHYGKDHIGSDHVVAVLSQCVPDSYLAQLREDGVSYVFAGSDGHEMAQALQTLHQVFGLERLLLEGGGIVNGAFLKQGLIDEISLMIYPGIDGLAGVPSTFGYVGDDDERPAAGQGLRLMRSETLEAGMVWLRYSVERVTA